MGVDLSSLIDLTETSAEKVLIISLLVIMMAYIGNLMLTVNRQGIAISADDSEIAPTSLPTVPEEVAEAVEAEKASEHGDEGDEDIVEEEQQGDATKED